MSGDESGATVLRILQTFFSPRGRVNRKGMLVVAGMLVVVETVGASLIWIGGVDPSSPLINALKAFFLWIAVSAVCKRLHDMGLSAWRLPTALALQVAWTAVLATTMFVSLGVEQMQPDSEGYRMMLAGCAAPIIAAALWLHLSAGESDLNSYGPAPDGLGFSLPGGAPGPAFENFAPRA